MKANSEMDRRKMTVSRVAKVCALAFCLITLVALVIAFSDVVYAVDGWYMKNARPAMAYKAIMSTYRLVIFAILFPSSSCAEGESPYRLGEHRRHCSLLMAFLLRHMASLASLGPIG